MGQKRCSACLFIILALLKVFVIYQMPQRCVLSFHSVITRLHGMWNSCPYIGGDAGIDSFFDDGWINYGFIAKHGVSQSFLFSWLWESIADELLTALYWTSLTLSFINRVPSQIIWVFVSKSLCFVIFLPFTPENLVGISNKLRGLLVMVVLSRNGDWVLVLHQGVLIQPRCTPLCHFADLLRRLIENVLNLFYRFLLFKMCFPKSL